MNKGWESVSVTGSSTIIVASLNEEGTHLGVSNLGDSSCLVLRRSELSMEAVFKSTEQQHAWNCPYQLCNPPSIGMIEAAKTEAQANFLRKSQTECVLDTPSSSDNYTFPVVEGDLILLATDGLFDNLFIHEIASMASLCVSPVEARRLGEPSLYTHPIDIASTLASAAAVRSVDEGALSPFSESYDGGGTKHEGGKTDDITVVCAWAIDPNFFIGSASS
eukprot:GHVR01178853.1.p1 GENE.GHVR01178853.1~~GHVR01178853.1.p1  ORF type:complete len:220 (-),score=59.83 GHVR01178853.1:302-961(-)